MNTSEFDDMWRLMSECAFVVDQNSSNVDLLCIICHNLMVDACQSFCGCRYCHKCISKHLSVGDKYCPGNKSMCKEKYLVMERDVSRVARMNNKISQLEVLCPNDTCQSMFRLLQMHDHLKVCTKQSMKCPYSTVGCENKEDAKVTIIKHISNNNLLHTQLLMEWINSMRNEIDGLKDYIENNKLEMSSLREDLKMKDIQIGEIMLQMAEEKKEIERVMETCRNKESRMVKLEAQLREVRNDMEIRVNVEKEGRTRSMESQRRNIEVVRNECRLRKDKMTAIVNSVKNDIDIMKDDEKKCGANKDRTMIKQIKLCSDVNYVWIVDEYAKKRGSDVFSEAFYINDYKLCLYMYIYDDDKLELYCYIMKGDSDDKVQWPMKHTVTLNIIDQDTLKATKTVAYNFDTYKYNNKAFCQTSEDMNKYGIGEGPFADYLSVKDRQSIIVNDRIIITCAFINA